MEKTRKIFPIGTHNDQVLFFNPSNNRLISLMKPFIGFRESHLFHLQYRRSSTRRGKGKCKKSWVFRKFDAGRHKTDGCIFRIIGVEEREEVS
jgi:hypothetical protein